MEWKTHFTDSLVQIAILLSLFRTDWNNYINSSTYNGYPEINEIINGPLSAYTQSYIHAPEWHSSAIGLSHPKALSLDYSSSIFRDIHMLGQYRRFDHINTDIDAYLVNDPVPSRLVSENAQTSESTGSYSHSQSSEDSNNNNQNTSGTSDSSGGSDGLPSPRVEGAVRPEENPLPELFSFPFVGNDGLTKEDLDLIEILWRQDIDLGVEREAFDIKQRQVQEKQREIELHQQREKEKQLERKTTEDDKSNDVNTQVPSGQDSNREVTYVVDRETGELVPASLSTSGSVPPQSNHVPFTNTPQQPAQLPPQQPQHEISIEEAMRMLEDTAEEYSFNPTISQNQSVQQGLRELEAMIQNSTSFTAPQNALHRQVSIEQRWQDITGILPLDGSTQPVTMDTANDTNLQSQSLLQNASFAPQVTPSNLSFGEGFGPMGYQNVPQNLLTPVDSAPNAHLLATEDLQLNNSGGVMTRGGLGAFVNSSDSLLHHLLNEDITDIDFSDLNITNTTEAVPMETNDVSSDSAISSAGSLSPTSRQALSSVGSPTQDLSDFQSNISSPFDTIEGATGGSSDGDGANSYHSMETKYKYDPDQAYVEPKYSSDQLYTNHSQESNSSEYSQHKMSADPRKVGHNHTYPLQPGQQPKVRKSDKTLKEEIDTTDIQYCRDQKRAKAMNIPFTMEEMITSPVDSFNEMLQQHQLTDTQLQLIRDIRRRGKNKVAAQNCRKRKLEVIQALEEEVQKMREDRDRLERERELLDKDSAQMKQKFSHLYQEVFQSLRDEHDRPYDPNEYSLQQTDDGEMYLVPHNATTYIKDEHKTKGNRKRKGERKD